MTTTLTIALAGVLLSNLYWWLTVLTTALFSRRRAESLPGENPPATIIIPLKGVANGLEENLRAFCGLDYPDYQVVFAVETPEDPAMETVGRVLRDFPQKDFAAVSCGRRVGANPKENNHAAAYALAKHPLIVLADGDVSVGPDYLRRVLAPFKDPGVGLVTCPYRFGQARTLWARLRALNIHAGFIPSVMLAWLLGPVRFGIGATLAVRREALERIGGFAALARYLASDYWLARKVSEAGWRVELLPYWVTVRLEADDRAAFSAYQLRWVRTMRFSAPAGYAGLLATQGLFWAAAHLAFSRFSPAGWAVLAAAAADRAATSYLVWRLLGIEESISSLLLLPLSDLLGTAFWLAGFLGDEVCWAGRRYRLAEGTRIRLGGDEPALQPRLSAR